MKNWRIKMVLSYPTLKKGAIFMPVLYLIMCALYANICINVHAQTVNVPTPFPEKENKRK